jgi:2-pyrone-4,6-dicarboxylate lactonase
MLEVMAANPDRLRGIAVAPVDLPERSWRELNEAGVRGLRLNTMTTGGIGFDNIDRYEAICAELGWHLQFLTVPDSLNEVAPRLMRLRVPCVIDHMGHFPAAGGIDSPSGRTMINLLKEGAWTKVSAAYRLSEAAPFTDTIPIARKMIETAPDRCVWGSDWPQPGYWKPMPNIGDLLDLLANWAPDPAVRDAILTTNAQRLYGLPA